MKDFFMKDTVEKEALYRLQQFDYMKYKDAVISDRPDIQNIKLSIGVEVTIADFQEQIMNTQFKGKTLIEYFKMNHTSFMVKKDLHYLERLSDNHPAVISFLSNYPVYEDKQNKPVIIRNKSDFIRLKAITKIYIPDELILKSLDDNGIIQNQPATAFWTGQIPEIMLNQVKAKEKKIHSYEVFNEMNLYIKCFSGDEEEIKDFEKLIHDYKLNNHCKFNRIYITNYWGGTRLFEIVL